MVSNVAAPVIELYRAFAAVASNVDQAHKAKVLGESISSAMNWSGFGVVTCLVPLVMTLVLWLRAPRAAAPAGEP